MKRWIVIALLIAWLGNALVLSARAQEPRLRYPIAAAWTDDAQLVVANRRSGSLSLVDWSQRKVTQELAIGKQLADLVVSSDKKWLLVADDVTQRVHKVTLVNGQAELQSSLVVNDYPTSIVLSHDQRQAFVTCLWSRRLDVVSIHDDSLRIVGSLPLPFAPRHQCLLPDGKLVVADAFGGQLAIVDTQPLRLMHVHKLQAHNITRLAWDHANQRLLVPHQILLETAATDVDNIQWGALMKNVVRVITLQQLLDPNVNLTTASRVISLGSEGEGNADPTCVLPLDDREFVVASGGGDRLLRVDGQGFITARVAVGEHPVQILPGSEAGQVVVVDQFSDTLTLVDLNQQRVEITVSLGEQRKLTPSERGERLFFSAQLSYDGWMSCHSCHTHGYTNGLRADTRGDGSFGAPKRTLSLLGVRDTDRWAWNGSIQNLQDQTRKSIETTMHGQASADEVFDLTAYLHTLDAPPARLKSITDTEQKQVARGKQVFAEQRCARCHVPPLTYTSQESYDVGLSDEHGQVKFNPPSLRGVGHGAAFLHDGRAQALEDVFQVHGHQLSSPLSDEQLADLIRFLNSL